MSQALTRLCSVCSIKPNFLVTVLTLLPSFNRSTAYSLNSAVYTVFKIFIIVSSVTVILRHPWKTKFWGAHC
jgi:hypothetical protein